MLSEVGLVSDLPSPTSDSRHHPSLQSLEEIFAARAFLRFLREIRG